MDFATVKKRLPNYRKYAICFVFLWIIITALLVLNLSGTVRTQCMGIQLDSNGNIYVGLTEEIRVFDKSGKLLRTIAPKTSKGYDFVIDGDQLLVDYYIACCAMDLKGNVLEELSRYEFPRTTKTPKTLTIHDTIYHIRCSNFFYRVTVEEQGEKIVAVQMPAVDLIVEMMELAVFVTFFIFILTLLRKLRKPA